MSFVIHVAFCLAALTALLNSAVQAVVPSSNAAALQNDMSAADFLDAVARDLFSRDVVDKFQNTFRNSILYVFNRYPPPAEEGVQAHYLPILLREGKVGSGLALDYWLERTLGKAREHAYKHIEKSYWAEQQKIEYNQLGHSFRDMEQAVHTMARTRFRPEDVAFFTNFVREYMKKPSSQTASVNDFVREFKAYVATMETMAKNGTITTDGTNNSTTNSNATDLIKFYGEYRDLGQFDQVFQAISTITDAFHAVEKMMGPVRAVVAFIPGIGCTLNALSIFACIWNENTGIAALLNGKIGFMDLMRCSLNGLSSVARGADGLLLSYHMLMEFFKGMQGGGGFSAGVNAAYDVVKESNINMEPWTDLGIEQWIPGHEKSDITAGSTIQVQAIGSQVAESLVSKAVSVVEGSGVSSSISSVAAEVGGGITGDVASGLMGAIENVASSVSVNGGVSINANVGGLI